MKSKQIWMFWERRKLFFMQFSIRAYWDESSSYFQIVKNRYEKGWKRRQTDPVMTLKLITEKAKKANRPSLFALPSLTHSTVLRVLSCSFKRAKREFYACDSKAHDSNTKLCLILRDERTFCFEKLAVWQQKISINFSFEDKEKSALFCCPTLNGCLEAFKSLSEEWTHSISISKSSQLFLRREKWLKILKRKEICEFLFFYLIIFHLKQENHSFIIH